MEPGFASRIRRLHCEATFGAGLVHDALLLADGLVLDSLPCACTTSITSADGREATVIEIVPVGVRLARAVEAVTGLDGVLQSVVRALGRGFGGIEHAP